MINQRQLNLKLVLLSYNLNNDWKINRNKKKTKFNILPLLDDSIMNLVHMLTMVDKMYFTCTKCFCSKSGLYYV